MMILTSTRNFGRIGISSLTSFIKRRQSSSASKEHMQLWWDVNGPHRAKHGLKKFIQQEMRAALKHVGATDRSHVLYEMDKVPLSGLTCLVVGCGGGIFTELIATLGAKEVVGIDQDEEHLAVAKDHCKGTGLKINYICTSLEKYAGKRPAHFDIVLLLNVIEQVERNDHEEFIRNAGKLLKIKGSVFIVTMVLTFESRLYAFIHNFIRQDSPPEQYLWPKFMKSLSLVPMLTKNHMDVIDAKGLAYCPNMIRWTSGPREDIFVYAHATKREEIIQL